MGKRKDRPKPPVVPIGHYLFDLFFKKPELWGARFGVGCMAFNCQNDESQWTELQSRRSGDVWKGDEGRWLGCFMEVLRLNKSHHVFLVSFLSCFVIAQWVHHFSSCFMVDSSCASDCSSNARRSALSGAQVVLRGQRCRLGLWAECTLWALVRSKWGSIGCPWLWRICYNVLKANYFGHRAMWGFFKIYNLYRIDDINTLHMWDVQWCVLNVGSPPLAWPLHLTLVYLESQLDRRLDRPF